ncbi:MAG: NADH-quinone oxidoreductase subunit C [Deltaproteobacteria bacterium]|nr:NADH-quinone oxidoreductase subunit C [Deltaproteobacteria bacterium]
MEVLAGAVPDVLRFLRDDPELSMRLFLDVTAVDYEESRGQLELIYVLRSPTSGERVLVKTRLDAADPRTASVSDVFAGANWAEREVYDMFGVHFEGHPNLRRILLYEEFEGHPLRKSYPYQKRQPLVPERDPIADPWPKKH